MDVRSMNEVLREAREMLSESKPVTQEMRAAGEDYLRKNAKKLTMLISGMSTHIKKETGQGVGFSMAGDIIRGFLGR